MVASAQQRFRIPDTWAGQSRPVDARALSLSVIFTAALFSLLLTISSDPSGTPGETGTIVFLSQYPPTETAAELTESPSGGFEETVLPTSSQAAPQSSPATVTPTIDVPIAPMPPIQLNPLILPEVEATGSSAFDLNGSTSENDRLTGREGPAGNGGQGIAGSGSGGSGGGAGLRTDLTARWAPSMDLDELDAFYPKEAAGTGIKGLSILKCKVLRGDRVRDCSLVLEKPQGRGFGAAALATEETLKVQVFDRSGDRVYDEWVLVNLISEPASKPCLRHPGRIRRCGN